MSIYELIQENEDENLINEFKNKFVELVDLISMKNKNTVNKFKKFMADPEKYIIDNKESMADFWGWSEEIAQEYIDEIDTDDFEYLCELYVEWLLFILEEDNFLTCRDYKDTNEDFTWSIENLQSFKTFNLELNEDWFEEGYAYVGDLAEIVDNKWEDKGYFLANINNGSSDFNLFICNKDMFEKLEEIFNKIGYEDFNIQMAKDS